MPKVSRGRHCSNTCRRSGKRNPSGTALIKCRILCAISLYFLRLHGVVDRQRRRYSQVQEEIRFLTTISRLGGLQGVVIVWLALLGQAAKVNLAGLPLFSHVRLSTDCVENSVRKNFRAGKEAPAMSAMRSTLNNPSRACNLMHRSKVGEIQCGNSVVGRLGDTPQTS